MFKLLVIKEKSLFWNDLFADAIHLIILNPKD